MNMDFSKENLDPNRIPRQKQSLNVSPKRRVIHLKSISKPKNTGSSNGMENRYINDLKPMEVADFM